MEKKPTILSFLSKVVITYGVTVLILNIFILLFGEIAEGYSTIFDFGNEALGIKTSFQFLFVTFILVSTETVFMTDGIIKKMGLGLRIVLMFLIIFTEVVVSVLLFDWFPVDKALPWIMFVICFAVCTAVSTFISVINKKNEDKKLEEALKRYKENR